MKLKQTLFAIAVAATTLTGATQQASAGATQQASAGATQQASAGATQQASAGATQQASAGPLTCGATATGLGLGWLAYGILRVVTAPTLVVTGVAEVPEIAAPGPGTINMVSCGPAPTP